MGEERKGHVPDPARRRGRRLSAAGGGQGGAGAARRQGPVPAGSLQRHRARLLQPEEQGRGARQCAVDRLDRAHAKGSIRHLKPKRQSQTSSPCAIKRQIKGWSRAKKEALIKGDWGEISDRAKRRGGRYLQSKLNN